MPLWTPADIRHWLVTETSRRGVNDLPGLGDFFGEGARPIVDRATNRVPRSGCKVVGGALSKKIGEK